MPANEDLLAWDKTVIAEFGANGKVASQPGSAILLLATTGARTDRRTTTPGAFLRPSGRA